MREDHEAKRALPGSMRERRLCPEYSSLVYEEATMPRVLLLVYVRVCTPPVRYLAMYHLAVDRSVTAVC